VRRLYLDNAVEAVHGGELSQLTRWVREGVISDRDGRSLEHRLEAVRVPTLVVSATRDRISPEANAYAAYSKIGSSDKHFKSVSRAGGARRDYAHADLLLADSSRRDVHQPIADWLSSREPRPTLIPAEAAVV
jgi:homoserine acetyltransferase